MEQKLGGVLLLRVEEEETADGKPTLIKRSSNFRYHRLSLVISFLN